MKFTRTIPTTVEPINPEDTEWYAVVKNGLAVAYLFYPTDAERVAKMNRVSAVVKVVMTP